MARPALPPKVPALLAVALSSDKVGEQTAALAAIKRVLGSSGYDLHDLIKWLTNGTGPTSGAATGGNGAHDEPLPARWADVPPHRRAGLLRRLAETDNVDDWQKEFLGSIASKLARGCTDLSDKQWVCLTRILFVCGIEP